MPLQTGGSHAGVSKASRCTYEVQARLTVSVMEIDHRSSKAPTSQICLLIGQ
jgi:hypothetical protein